MRSIYEIISRLLSPVMMLVFFMSLSQAQADVTYELECLVDRKIDRQTEYSRSRIDEMRWSVVIRHYGQEYATISRCDSKAPCDDYRADHFEFTKNVGVSKYYYFSGQFDVQVFGDGRFIENNGRGTLAFGQCQAK